MTSIVLPSLILLQKYQQHHFLETLKWAKLALKQAINQVGKSQPMKQDGCEWCALTIPGELWDGEKGRGDKVKESRPCLTCIFLTITRAFVYFESIVHCLSS